MRGNAIVPCLSVTVSVVTPAWSQSREEADVSSRVARLASPDRTGGHAAAVSLQRVKLLPESAIEPIISYLKFEVEQAMVPNTVPNGNDDDRLDSLPVVGDETTLVRIKANPDQYINKPFIVAGGLKIANYYNFGFRQACRRILFF